MLLFVSYAVWELWVGLANGYMTPLAPTGSYLSATRASNPVGSWLATTFNVMLIVVGLFVAFLP
jgi:hypothetical protein